MEFSDSDTEEDISVNQGARNVTGSSTSSVTNAPILTNSPVSSRTRSKSGAAVHFAQDMPELENLGASYLSEKQKLIADGTLYSMEDVTHGLMDLVGGTDTSKQVPNQFQETWNHEDEEERNLWREAIRKEFRDMIKRKVWMDFKKSKVPSSRRLIGTKWVFRVKNDGRHRARLCAIGYNQIAGVDFQDNFAPVINDVTFRIIMTLLITNNWDADIVDIERAFLYGSWRKRSI